jgi:hypothetical protein
MRGLQTESQKRRRPLAKDRRRSLFRDALISRFGRGSDGVRRCLAAMGMDENLLGEIHNEKSRSIMDTEKAHKMMAEHGHAVSDEPGDFDAMDADWREQMMNFARDKSFHVSDEDLSTLWSMIPRKQAIEGEDDLSEQEERQHRLEGSERRFAPEDRRDDTTAELREMRNSEQSEDNLRRNHINGNGRGGRLATDHELAGLDELINRVGISMSTPAARQLEAKIKSRHDPSPAYDEDDFLKRFPEAARIGFSR